MNSDLWNKVKSSVDAANAKPEQTLRRELAELFGVPEGELTIDYDNTNPYFSIDDEHRLVIGHDGLSIQVQNVLKHWVIADRIRSMPYLAWFMNSDQNNVLQKVLRRLRLTNYRIDY